MSRTVLTALAAMMMLTGCHNYQKVFTPAGCRYVQLEDTLRVLTIETRQDSLILRTTCADLRGDQIGSPEFKRFADRLIATVTSPSQDGVGIAAPQVGVTRRVIAVQRFDKEGEPFEVYPNARIAARRGEDVAGPEGCLSIPGRRGMVLRSRDIDISYTSPFSLKDTMETVQGFTAVIFQHECDHLDGVLYIDKLAE